MATQTYTPSSNDILHSVEVDLITRDHVVEPIHIVQNDKVLPILEIVIFRNGLSYFCPTGSTASIRLEKPDGKIVYTPVTGWDSTRQKIYVKTTYQMTSAFGKAKAVIEIDTGSAIAQTEPFTILIDRNPVQQGAIESTDEIKSLQSYVDQAKASATQAQGYRDTASSYATNARNSATEATSAKNSASTYANNAKTSETNASNSAQTAKNAADNAEDFSDLSESYAVGTNNVVRPGDKTDNAKAYSELAQRLTDEANKLLEEARKLMDEVKPAGTVTGVKGNKETEYRSGNVNLTPTDIGAVAIEDLPDLSIQSVKFVGKIDELKEQIASGEVEEGTIAFIEDVGGDGSGGSSGGGTIIGDLDPGRLLMSDEDGNLIASSIEISSDGTILTPLKTSTLVVGTTPSEEIGAIWIE